MNLKALATRTFGPLVDKTGDIFFITKESLPRADIKITFRTFMSMAFFAAALVLVSSIFMIAMVTSVISVPLFLKLAMFAFVPMLNAIVTVFVVAFYPYQKVASRRKSIEMNLPFVLTHMGAIAESGVPPYVIFRLIAEFEEYGEVAAEMKKVIRNIEMFGLNPLAAVREVAARTPSDELKQIMLGFVTTTESGGDVKLFLKNAGTQALFEWRIKREKFLQQLSAYAEFYTGIMIAAPLFIIALFAVMNMIQSTIAGYDIMFLTKLSIYGVVPGMNIVFLLFLQGTEVEM
jgi:archaellum biogenesis protein FlaJ (TadC family)